MLREWRAGSFDTVLVDGKVFLLPFTVLISSYYCFSVLLNQELHNIRDYDDHLRLGVMNLGNQIVLLIHEDDDLFCVSDRNSGALNDRNSSQKAASPDANYL